MKVRMDELEGRLISSGNKCVIEENIYLNSTTLRRVVLHPGKELKIDKGSDHIYVILHGKAEVLIKREVVIIRSGDVLMVNDTKNHTILNISEEDLIFLEITNKIT